MVSLMAPNVNTHSVFPLIGNFSGMCDFTEALHTNGFAQLRVRVNRLADVQ